MKRTKVVESIMGMNTTTIKKIHIAKIRKSKGHDNYNYKKNTHFYNK